MTDAEILARADLIRKAQEAERATARDAKIAAIKDGSRVWSDDELVFAATSRCKCGAGLAHPRDTDEAMFIRAWACSAFLKGEVDGQIGEPKGGLLPADDAVEHHRLNFAFWKVREEGSINNHAHSTTRPGEKRLWRMTLCECGACGAKWEIGPHTPYRNIPAGACPTCGNTNGSNLSSNSLTPAIRTRHPDVLVTPEQMSAAVDAGLAA